MHFRVRDATDVAAEINAHHFVKQDILENSVALIKRENPHFNAVVDLAELSFNSDPSLEIPAKLNGIPFLIKELGTYGEGLFYREGSARLSKDATRAKRSSGLVGRLKKAGAVLIGSTATSEFGLEARTETSTFGAVSHPWIPGRSTGGSSGGSASAVARGWVPFAHATDGAGSIRLPAAFCGVIGLKPSRGRVSFGPSIGETLGLFASNFFITRSIRDTALLLDVSTGKLPGDYVGQMGYPKKGWLNLIDSTHDSECSRLRIGLSYSLPVESPLVDSDIQATVTHIADKLEAHGHNVGIINTWLFGTNQTREDFGVAWYAMAAESVRRVGGFGEGLEPYSEYLARWGESISAGQLAESLGRLTRLGRFVESKIFQDFDVIMTPVCPVFAPELLTEKPLTLEERLRESLDILLPFTYGVNILGYPAISIPLISLKRNEPCGLQIIARMGREDLILRLSRELETLNLVKLSPLILNQ